MAVTEVVIYEALCDGCGLPYDHKTEPITPADALEDAARAGWSRDGDEGLLCPDRCADLTRSART